MPLVILSGQPCSGKTLIASKLADKFRALGLDVTVVDEPSLHLSRNTSYSTNFNEKNTRALLKSTVERAISRQGVVILDSLNNIKGYRYELWCIARAAATRYCMVHVATPTDVCRRWNETRGEEEGYSSAVFEDLAGRFETPDSRNRWDSPLFTVLPADCRDNIPDAPEQSEEEVLEAIVLEMTRADDPNPNANKAKTLQPTMATSNPALASTDTLAEIDTAIQNVLNLVMEAQSSSGSGAAGTVHLGKGLPPLHLDRSVGLAELRRHKRAFLKLVTKITFSRIQASDTAKRMFVDYLNENLRQT